jgi:Bacterial extracellular solute-binding protein/von Willebrand factor type A domain
MARRARTTAQGPPEDGSSGAPARGRGGAGAARRGRGGLSTPALVTASIGVSALVLVGLSFQTIQAHKSCENSPVLNIAVSDDLAPAVGQVAQNFNAQHHIADGHCVQVQITEAQSSTVAARLDGQGSSAGQAPVAAWIPDSTLWVDVVRSYPKGAQAIQRTGIEVAESPLMTVMSAGVARETGAFDSPAGWNVLLPAADGGPPASLGMKVLIPDPADSAAGLATLVELSRLVGSGASARAAFTSFVIDSEATSEFDNSTSLASFVATGGPPFNSRSVTVTSEQAVIAYDRANPKTPLAAQYPTGLQGKLGTQALDYPFVLTSADPAQQAAAREFEQALRSPYAASLIRYDGFRTAGGVADQTPASFGLQTQMLQQAAGATASEAQTNLEAWGRLSIGSAVLTLIDVSKSMGLPDGNGAQTLEQETTLTTVAGLALFPDNTQIGLWEIADNFGGGKPYQQLVSLGGLTQQLGLITRRQQLQQIDETLHPGGQTQRLNDAILDGYKAMIAQYRPDYQNALIVLTSGVDDGPGDMSTAALVAQLRKLFNPNRGVQIIIDQLGTAGNFAAMQQIASVTGGAAFLVSNPANVGKEFIQAFSHRLCDPRCSPTP